MALLDHFRRRAIRDHATAGAFIDEQSFHLAETCVRDYSRLRAGDGAEALFADLRSRLRSTRRAGRPIRAR